ncbi:hypothetical protein PAHAL_1G169500 [Panicum hallii]|uniref:Uncharacterized protein n=1 Tax=Panicum hallii TaxID=206008 RepID=A0A2S3GNN5_9POAL|nr:hypothetical protein PAHAL_1G169500 [Panicum hallii]
MRVKTVAAWFPHRITCVSHASSRCLRPRAKSTLPPAVPPISGISTSADCGDLLPSVAPAVRPAAADASPWEGEASHVPCH